jgi:hypothetical protein
MCSRAVLNLSFHTSMDVVTYGTVLPLTLGLETAWGNCNRAYTALADLKGAASALYLQLEVWGSEVDGELGHKAFALLSELVRYIQIYCTQKPSAHSIWWAKTSAADGRAARLAAEHHVWDIFAEISLLIEDGSRGLGTDPEKGGQAGKGRCFECVRKMLLAWEHVRTARTYLSPRSLRAFTAMTIHLAPLFLAPYWHSFCGDLSALTCAYVVI